MRFVCLALKGQIFVGSIPIYLLVADLAPMPLSPLQWIEKNTPSFLNIKIEDKAPNCLIWSIFRNS